MKEYTLIPKSGKGCKWFMKKEEMFNGNYVKVNDHNGFETIVDIRNYNIYE